MTATRPVAVYDVNVLLSGLIWRGAPYRCLALARAGIVDAVTCQPAIDITMDKLAGKFGLAADDLTAALADLLSFCRLVPVPAAVPAVTVDAEDNRILACCAAAQADYLVTGDRRHLLPLGRHGPTVIVGPAEFLRPLDGRPRA